MPEQDLYAVLGVARNADADTIKKAFRAAALRFHPDRNPGNKAAEDQFKAVNRAYEVLSDPQRKQMYDQFGDVALRDGFDPSQFRHSQGPWSAGGGVNMGDLFGQGFGGAGGGTPADFSQIFDQFFQGQRPSSVPGGGPGRGGFGGPGAGARATGRNLEAEISVDLPTAVRGGEISINFNGQPLRVRIPSGVRPGARVRVPGKGMPSPAGPPGDLILTLRIAEHPFFVIEGDDLGVRIPLTLLEAWRGARVKIPTPDGEVVVKTPPRANSGMKLRVRGKGMPATQQQPAGDLIVTLMIALPPNVPAADALMAQLENVYLGDPRADLRF